jgi:beta-N-acetylhexosaminidase
MHKFVAAVVAAVLASLATPMAARSAPLAVTRQLAGQRVIYSYPGLTPPANLLQHIRDGEVAGVIFFKENIAGLDQIRSVTAQLAAANAQSPVKAPLLLMTDQEGGQVRRLPGAPVLSEKQIGQSADSVAAAEEAGTTAGENLRGAGMNVNLAPVVDVYRTPGDFLDQYQRSYSQNPATVAVLSPGLGSATTQQNTDLGPVTLNASLSTLRNVDEAPYTAGAKLVMLSWAVYPALDGTRPAGLSRAVIQDELRGHLGYTGVTVSDAIEANALQAYGTAGQRGVLAAQAGIDLLLCSARDVKQGEDSVTAMVDALNSGQLDPGVFNAAAQRVTALRVNVG